MKYSKPEVVVLGSALAVVQQGDEKGGTQFPDAGTPAPQYPTPNAYQADE